MMQSQNIGKLFLKNQLLNLSNQLLCPLRNTSYEIGVIFFHLVSLMGIFFTDMESSTGERIQKSLMFGNQF
jgi:hypothetical protein